MNWRKHLGLLISGGVALGLLLVALFFLWRFYLAYSLVQDSLQARTQRLDALFRRTPYPSESNVQAEQRNLLQVQQAFTNLTATLAQQQVTPVKIEPAQFPILLQKKVEHLAADAKKNNVSLPADFALGFDTYYRGKLPLTADIPRLVLQLNTIEALCEVFFRSQVTALVSLQRQIFEQEGENPATTAPAVMGRRGMVSAPVAPEGGLGMGAAIQTDPDGLFTAERYVVSLRVKEIGVWALLNNLAGCRPFVTVVRLQTVADKTEQPKQETRQPVSRAPDLGREGLPGGAEAGTNTVPLARSERIVAGAHEEVVVTVELKCYRFLFPGTAREEAKP